MKTIPDEILNDAKNMIYSIALKYKNLCEVEDTYQAGVIGLIKAYKNYNQNSNADFTSYAYMYIYGEILKTVKENRNIKISDDYFKIFKAYEKTKDCLRTHLDREPSLKEISSFMKIDESFLSNVINSCSFTVSLNVNNNDEEYDLLNTYKIDKSDSIDRLLDLKIALSKLKKEEKKLIDLRYFKDYTQTETARKLNMSQVEVSRNESKILKKINHEMMV